MMTLKDSIYLLQLSERTNNALVRNKLFSITDLRSVFPSLFPGSKRGLGVKALSEISAVLGVPVSIKERKHLTEKNSTKEERELKQQQKKEHKRNYQKTYRRKPRTDKFTP